MRYKKTILKNTRWTKTCHALKELFETLRCSKCESSLHDSQQFLECGHFSCFSCIKNSNKCIECHFSVNNDVLKDDTIKKIVQACCTIAEAIGFKEINNGVETISEESPTNEQTNSSNLGQNNESNQSNEKPRNVSKKRKGIKKFSEIVSKKAKLDNIIPSVFRIPKNVDKKNHHGETKLQEECKKGHIDNVRALLDAGANPNTCCAAGWTPLQECADYGYIEIAKLLLDRGADIDKKGFQGRTPLHEAIQADTFAMVQFLLEHNAQKDIEDDNHNKPIEYCKSERIKMLLTCDTENGSSYISKTARNYSAPHITIRNISPGVSYNSFKDNHNVSAIHDVKVDECDNSNSESEDDGVPGEEKYSQNITISHQEYACQTFPNIDNDPLDSEEIDILN